MNKVVKSFDEKLKAIDDRIEACRQEMLAARQWDSRRWEQLLREKETLLQWEAKKL